MLDGPRRGAADRGRNVRGAVRRDDNAACARSFCAPDHRTEVPRVADLVEAREQRRVARGELERVGVAERLAPRHDALVVARPRGLEQITFELGLDARPLDLAQPGLAPHRPLARPQLEHLAPPSQRLAHRTAPVDELPRHERRTSR